MIRLFPTPSRARGVFIVLALLAGIATCVPFGSVASAAPTSARARAYTLKTSGPLTVRVGRRGVASLTIAPARGQSIFRDARLSVSLTVEPKKGVVLPRHELRRQDAADAQADAPRFDLVVQAKKTGKYKLSVSVRFWICAKRTCRPVHDRVEIPVVVGPAAKAP